MPAMAQNDPAPGGPPPAGDTGGQGGPGGGQRRFDPAQFRQRMLDRMKDELGASDDEFKAIQPKLEKVFELQRDARGGGMRGGRRGGPDAAATDQPKSAVQKAQEDLRKTLENKDAPADEIKTKMVALRDAKSKAKEDLVKAQADLRDLLTQRQEAVLVMAGLLD